MNTTQANTLKAEHTDPDLTDQINRGLIIALTGEVKPVDNGADGRIEEWLVKGNGGKYTITRQGIPNRWACDCPQGQDFGPVVSDFAGHPGRICKHIAAVALTWLGPPPQMTVWDLLVQMVNTEHLPPLGQTWDLPRCKCKVEYYGKHECEGIVLKTGRKRSGILARQVMIGYDGVGQAEWGWRLVNEARSRYNEFVEDK